VENAPVVRNARTTPWLSRKKPLAKIVAGQLAVGGDAGAVAAYSGCIVIGTPASTALPDSGSRRPRSRAAVGVGAPPGLRRGAGAVL